MHCNAINAVKHQLTQQVAAVESPYKESRLKFCGLTTETPHLGGKLDATRVKSA